MSGKALYKTQKNTHVHKRFATQNTREPCPEQKNKGWGIRRSSNVFATEIHHKKCQSSLQCYHSAFSNFTIAWALIRHTHDDCNSPPLPLFLPPPPLAFSDITPETNLCSRLDPRFLILIDTTSMDAKASSSGRKKCLPSELASFLS